MKAENLLEAIGSVDEALLERSEQKIFKWKKQGRFVAAVACIVLIAIGFYRGKAGSLLDRAGSGSNGHADGSTAFMHYEGPVFPLTFIQKEEEIKVERSITFDFADTGQAGGETAGGAAKYGNGCMVTDEYILENTSDINKTVTAVYPYAGSFYSKEDITPQVQTNAGTVTAEPFAGICSNVTEDISGVQIPRGIVYSGSMESWEDYKGLVSDGSYMQSAFAETESLTEPVVVYQFTDSAAPSDKYQAATVAMNFKLPQGAKILYYNVEGMSWDQETRACQYSYFVPREKRKNELKLIAVLGGDIGDYTLQGYTDGSCDKRKKADDVTANVSRREMTIEDLIMEVLVDYMRSTEQGGKYWRQI